ncbi:hypothetical protein SELSPUOL_00176 [Selenomonas sputigena ATCC 35185]|uniref:Uncharacterized protein n=1 Tax=Selenomonas sputigena (strain ATCC 35185 / DSM 20758 / CCUG 44933 / VPI D19B-28) TaxID=546271 RepID=C9LRV6_SELS3|nr:hypothetical protein SELSPUOL_00176 [Selenomonas sputigena ATCC 35185]
MSLSALRFLLSGRWRAYDSQGEADFVVLHPTGGIFHIGGNPCFRGGGFNSTSMLEVIWTT